MTSGFQDSSIRVIFQKYLLDSFGAQGKKEKEDGDLQKLPFQGIMQILRECIELIKIKCSFAHGDNELRDRVPANENFKTKPCKNYHKFGVCSYGLRCQYLHSEIKDKIKWWGYIQKQFKKNMVPFTFPWDKQEKTSSIQRIDILRFQRVFKDYQEVEQQLSYFKNLCV